MATNEPNKPDNVINIDPGNKTQAEEKAAPDQPLQTGGEAPAPKKTAEPDKAAPTPAPEEKALAPGKNTEPDKTAPPPAPEEKAPEPAKQARRGRPAKADKADKPEKAPKEKPPAEQDEKKPRKARAPKQQAPAKEETPAPEPEQPPQPREAPRPNGKDEIVYERLSRDDGDDKESNSISTQKNLLEQYAKNNGLPNPTHFTDDGISGTRFDRPGFMAMMEEVEAGNVECIVIKDMSRLGRDYLKVGQIMEMLRQRGIRLIAVNDGIDTEKGEDDFLPFRNIMHEWYARDTSKKIKSTFKTKGMSGKHCTGTVIYGYLWDDKREQWIVDDEAAEVVRSIFRMTMEGFGPYQISQILTKKEIEIPSVHLARHGEGVNKNKTVKNIYGWGSSAVVHILRNREYLGHTCNFKTRKHFKDKKSHYVPESEWTIFENTHEAIIDQDTFDNVQRIRNNVRRYPDGWGEAHPLTGLMYCADCGGKMYVHRTNNGKRIAQYTCSQYSKVPVGVLCGTQHRINAEVVLTLIADMLKAIAEYSKNDRAEFIKAVQDAQETQRSSDIAKKKKRLVMAQKRAAELEKLICKIYEDSVLRFKFSDELRRITEYIEVNSHLQVG